MKRLSILVAALVAATSPVLAHDYKAGTLVIDHPWSRATPAGASVAGGYMKITNSGDKPDRLVGGSWGDGGKIEVHEMATANGVMTMRPLREGLPLPANATIELKPGSYHLMMLGVKTPFKDGQSVKGTLVFETAGTVAVEFKVGPLGGPSPGEHQH